jgi:hypothetical protein
MHSLGRSLVFLIASIGFLVVAAPAEFPGGSQCASCHAGIEWIREPETSMMQRILALGQARGDPAGCVVCHGGDSKATTAGAAHAGPDFYADPASPWINEHTCGQCHPRHVRTQWTSLMMTEAAYTYIRDRCDRCHWAVQGRRTRGDFRGMGCSACHIPYGTDGYYEGGEPTIPKDKPGHLLVHSIQATRGAKVTVHGRTYTGIPDHARPQIEPIAGLMNDWSRVVTESGEQLMTVGGIISPAFDPSTTPSGPT